METLAQSSALLPEAYSVGVADVVRVLRAFDRKGDALVGEWPIEGLALPDLQRLFGQTDEMLDSYPVKPEHVAALEKATGQSLDLGRCDYFLDADSGTD